MCWIGDGYALAELATARPKSPATAAVRSAITRVRAENHLP